MKQKSRIQKVCIIGQGFVGLPMSIAVSNAKNKKGKKYFEVIGIEKNNKNGKLLKKKINSGILPIHSSDNNIYKKFKNSLISKNFKISNDLNEIRNVDVVIISINFEINNKSAKPFENLKTFFSKISKIINKNALVIIETTLPPGTCDKIILPIFKNSFKKRGFDEFEVKLSFSYERIMPGQNYYDSIINNFRVLSGVSKKTKNLAKNFFSKIINTDKYPLAVLKTNTECEFSKILENSYRATNIAFIDEWTKFSKISGVNIYNVIDAIKKRETHKNIMRPGLGVGGYCLTKDPTFAPTAVNKIFKKKLNFPFVNLTMKTNKNMPKTSVQYIKEKSKKIKSKKVLILGLSYREGIGDFRSSPSLVLYKQLKKLGAKIEVNDVFLKEKTDKKVKIKFTKQKFEFNRYDIVIFCTPHKEYKKLNLNKFKKKSIIFDLNNCIPIQKKKRMINRLNIFTLGMN
tara:strand:+ start:949 stop:2325 length:1377 start_codon:yes stop_codon:yes gene_type:complete